MHQLLCYLDDRFQFDNFTCLFFISKIKLSSDSPKLAANRKALKTHNALVILAASHDISAFSGETDVMIERFLQGFCSA